MRVATAPLPCPVGSWPVLAPTLAPGLPVRVALCLVFSAAIGGALAGTPARAQALLPDAPDALLHDVTAAELPDAPLPSRLSGQTTSPTRTPHCRHTPPARTPETNADEPTIPCREENPVESVVSRPVVPLTVKGKGLLAIRDFDDPFNLITIAGYSGIAVAANAHSAFGPGFPGWGRLTGYSLLEDAQGEFVGTFLIPSIAHEDPRYHRLPGAPVKRRILHAIAHTYVSQHDDGSHMLNYATLLNYPISAELANLYVPGIQTDGPSTARRFATGIATDPAGTLVAEFLPDIARHIHIHIIVVQEILNQVATGANMPNVQ